MEAVGSTPWVEQRPRWEGATAAIKPQHARRIHDRPALVTELLALSHCCLMSITEGGRQTNKPSELRYSRPAARVALAMAEGQELHVVEAGPLTAAR